MSEHAIVWTVLPHGWVERAGRRLLRISVFVAPRLTPQAADEQVLSAFPDWADWPATLAGLRFGLSIDGQEALPLQADSAVDAGLWSQVFPGSTPVAGWTFTDMSRARWRSYPVRTIAETVRRHHGRVAQDGTGHHPVLLPGEQTDPALRAMLLDLGLFRGATTHVGHDPGFERTMTPEFDAGIDRIVHGERSPYTATVRGPKDEARTVRLKVLPPALDDPRHPSALRSAFRTEAEYALYQADRFYRRRHLTATEKALRRPDFKDVPPPPKPPGLDFHGIVASLGDHPALMRALGLVLDFVLPPRNPVQERLRQGPLPATGRASLVVKGLGGSRHRHPQTAWQASRERFLARAEGPDLADGLLRLEGAAEAETERRSKGPFDLHAFDPDGAALKTVAYLLSSGRLLNGSVRRGTSPGGEVTYTTGDRQPLAALRSGSLSLSRHGRAEGLAARAAQIAAKQQALVASVQQGRDVTFVAEDLLRGYRVDVLDRGLWRPLLARAGDYRLRGDGPLRPHGRPVDPDEGYVKAASTSSPPGAGGQDDDEHYLHEIVCRWAGWSLAVPRPGRAIRDGEDPTTGLQTEQPTELAEADAAPEGSPVHVQFRVPRGSLPRLRFGQSYRFRLRLADLAGNGLALEEVGQDAAATEQASAPIVYGRLEPLDPPALVQRHRLSEGESLERLVIRSADHADLAADYAAGALAEVQAKRAQALPPGAEQDFVYGPACERHAVPPKTSQWQAEQHGAFDRAFDDGSPAALNAAYAVAAREAGTLFDAPPGAQVSLVTPRRLDGIATTTALPVRLPQPDAPAGDRLAAGQYLIHAEARIETPYLSDPAAEGLVLRDLPLLGAELQPLSWPDGATLTQAVGGEWVLKLPFPTRDPHAPVDPALMRQGLRLQLVERPMAYDRDAGLEQPADAGLPHWDPEARLLTLFLPKGRQVTLRYACYGGKAWQDHFALPRWTGSPSAAQRLGEQLLDGVHPMVAPFRSLSLVHATQRPVFAPRFVKLGIGRQPGATEAQLRSPVIWHGPSTGQLEVHADWVEWVDAPERPGPVRVSGSARLARIELPVGVLTLPHPITQPGDPRRQRDLDALVDLLAPAAPAAAVRGDRHEFGDTRFRLVRYRLVATSRFREYLPPELWDEGGAALCLDGPAWEPAHYAIGAEDDPGAPVQALDPAAPPPAAGSHRPGVLVRASARPAAPVPDSVLPTVRWLAPADAAEGPASRTRLGQGLRVYLERPWFSSGDGELLGVVLAADGAVLAQTDHEQAEYVSQWGQDPVWRSTVPTPTIGASAFALAVRSESVTLPERGGASVFVVGHRVEWDAGQRRWFCDIEVNAGPSYMPFVRLALVRYQPHALAGAKVSPVVMAEFAQLLPRRRCTLELPPRLRALPADRLRLRPGVGDAVALDEPLRPNKLPRPPQASCRVYGVVPEAGSAAAEPAFADLSPAQLLPGALPGSVERSRNRIELVLQGRPAGAASDLAWHDLRVLDSGPAAPAASPRPLAQPVGRGGLGRLQPTQSLSVRPAVERLDALRAIERFDPDRLPVQPLPRPELALLEEPCWSARFSLPDEDRGPDRRIVVREFERFHSDRLLTVDVDGRPRPQRILEERLVFAATFPT